MHKKFGHIAFGIALLHVLSFEQARAEVDVPEITVLGENSKTSAQEIAQPVTVLSGRDLDSKRSTSLGETVSKEPGVSSTSFGAGASRPVIRGLGGDRIRILENGTGTLDASASSEDHAVAVDTLAIERVEIVRGAATLLYGSRAIGGVVNSITNRIPENAIDGFSGKGELKSTSVDGGTSAGLVAEFGTAERWAFHLDGSSRNARDYFAKSTGRVENSFNRAANFAGGVSYLASNGFVGAAVSNQTSAYGTVAEKTVSIEMKQSRYEVSAAVRDLGWFESIRIKNTFADYRHQEINAGVVGTTFLNRGDEARIDFKHRPIGAFNGVVGTQGQIFDFEALGEEAFLPATHNQSYGIFIFEEAEFNNWTPSFGARVEKAGVQSKSTAAFGPGETKQFTAPSALVGLMYDLSAESSVAVNLGYTERTPNYQELFANGAHVATRTFEVGNKLLGNEKAYSAELSLRRKQETVQASVGIYLQEFRDFVAPSATGNTRLNVEGDPLPEYAYRAVEARLYGAEAELKHQMHGLIPGGVLELTLKFDTVYGRDRSSGLPLPRMTPQRESLGLKYKSNRFSLEGDIQRVERQTALANGETPTDGHTLVSIGGELPVRWDVTTLSLFAHVKNLMDVDARNHVSILKDAAPLPGRSFAFGVQALF